ncbi:uncharacterized protein BDZ83DRAFT_729418 [Colletotrichum acutatum]|uniref:Uncharacterized protein n=1 Tax=Glomerella acutata TaxID=27357 RepID=A0AAD8UQ05_GLOAC|nr:uncharacterized protein BDZ83DRAFT_729418 [Colletotrichum acutatum]KAK1726757.1 hypothetical protein BDZ83DRAFT_729418 [Colletotrichum acutatum]
MRRFFLVQSGEASIHRLMALHAYKSASNQFGSLLMINSTSSCILTTLDAGRECYIRPAPQHGEFSERRCYSDGACVNLVYSVFMNALDILVKSTDQDTMDKSIPGDAASYAVQPSERIRSRNDNGKDSYQSHRWLSWDMSSARTSKVVCKGWGKLMLMREPQRRVMPFPALEKQCLDEVRAIFRPVGALA